MAVKFYKKNFSMLTEGINAAREVSQPVTALYDFLAENSEEWRDEANNGMLPSELYKSLYQAFLRGENDNPYVLKIEKTIFTISKNGVDVLVLDGIHIGWDIIVPIEVKAFPSGWRVTANGTITYRNRNISEVLKAAVNISPDVRDLVEQLRTGSLTFRRNYDDSYVTTSEMLVSVVEYMAVPRAYSVSITGEGVTFTKLVGTTVKHIATIDVAAGTSVEEAVSIKIQNTSHVSNSGWTEVPPAAPF